MKMSAPHAFVIDSAMIGPCAPAAVSGRIAKAREPMRMRETVRSELPGFMYRNAAPYARAL